MQIGGTAIAHPPAHTPVHTSTTQIGPEHDTDASLPRTAVAVANYTLHARLDEQNHTISGKGKLRWVNRSNQPVRRLYFHLYLNAFKNEKTLFLRSPFVTARDEGRLTDFGYIDVKSMRAAELGNVDLWKQAKTHSPGDADDETDIEVPLPEAIDPGASLTLDFEFESKLPRVLARTGHADGFHMVAQWYPKIAKLEPDGSFAHFAFHPHAEFYADFGSYDVTLDVADGIIVGATGAQRSDEHERGRRRVRFTADNVHDFAWCAWRGFAEETRRIGSTEVRLLYPPGHEANAARTLTALTDALPRIEGWLGAYPHGTLTVVHPPTAATAAGGMEYPTLITTGGPWWSAYDGTRVMDGLAIHELAHQWFQGMVATNEAEYPFLDEGLTSYVEQVVLEEQHGTASFGRVLGYDLDAAVLQRAAAARVALDDPMAQPAAAFSSFSSIGGLVYARTTTVLETLARVWGRNRVKQALGRYARAFRFRHPTPQDFESALEHSVGRQAAQVFRRAVFDRGFVDFAVEVPENARNRPPGGVFRSGQGNGTQAAAEGWSSRVILRRHGTLEIPVEVELRFADGRRTRRSWDGQGTWKAIDVVDSEPVVAAVVDPDQRVLLDQDLANNAVSTEPRLPWRSMTRLGYWSALTLSVLPP